MDQPQPEKPAFQPTQGKSYRYSLDLSNWQYLHKVSYMKTEGGIFEFYDSHGMLIRAIYGGQHMLLVEQIPSPQDT